MKPKELKYPFTWETRQPIFEDRVLFIPKYYQAHKASPSSSFSAFSWFGNSHPVCIEYCSGNGLWILERALAFPEKNWIAVEKRFDRTRKIWAKIKNYQLANLVVVCGDAESFSEYYVTENTIDEIYINFPDPWPKDKHAKHRIVKKPFIDRLSYICKEGATATLVTDDINYSIQMIDVMRDSRIWSSMFSHQDYITEWPEYGHSYFDELFRNQGRTIRYMHYTNTKKNHD
ncbi:MAG: tRNA (guanine(46)-N(7))-methyltransferase TrmB [Chlamydiae bacterium]|nr:tRNA (guanine(46)-N(7))-methyltransferase TrmB [Chlamydiota bacterium]